MTSIILNNNSFYNGLYKVNDVSAPSCISLLRNHLDMMQKNI